MGLLRDERVMLPTTLSSTLLCSAASNGDTEGIRLLQLCGVNLDRGDYDGRTPLMLAAAENHTTTLFYLLYTGADPNQHDRWGGTPLNDAVRLPSDIQSRTRTRL